MCNYLIIMYVIFLCLILSLAVTAQNKSPNILWIAIEDWSQDLFCYGIKRISTPFVDQLTTVGTRCTDSFTTSPVCSTSSSAMMTGFYQSLCNRFSNSSTPYKVQLTTAQALFFAVTKPEIELFDINKDPFEIYNLANNVNFSKVKATLLAELADWKTNVIKDKGVSDEFRAWIFFQINAQQQPWMSGC